MNIGYGFKLWFLPLKPSLIEHFPNTVRTSQREERKINRNKEQLGGCEDCRNRRCYLTYSYIPHVVTLQRSLTKWMTALLLPSPGPLDRLLINVLKFYLDQYYI